MLARLAAACTLLISTALVSGCGFHLVEPHPAGVNLLVHVVNQNAPLVTSTLNQELQLRQIKTVGSAPDVELILKDEQVDNRLLAIDSEGRAAEYQLEHTLQVSAIANGQRGDWHSFTATRDYTYDESNVLGKSQEQLLIRQTLREELAQRIVERYLYPARTEVLASTSANLKENKKLNN